MNVVYYDLFRLGVRSLFHIACTVLAKIIEPRHKINVYEKFYFSRKSIFPLLYNTI